MIKVDVGIVKIEGTQKEILSDLSTIASNINEYLSKEIGRVKAEEKILLAMERGFLINEKMDAEIAYEIQKITKKIEEKVG